MELMYAVGTIIGIAVTLVLRDYRDGKNVFKKNATPADLNEGFKYMKHHYNDELTMTLTQIQFDSRQGFRDMKESLEKINEALIRIEVGGIKMKNLLNKTI